MYARFPYNITESGGWNDENGCTKGTSVKQGGGAKTGSAHAADWATVDETTQWIKQVAHDPMPFFVYQGTCAAGF